MVNMTFGEYLKELIKSAGMTQRSFYIDLDIKKPYFYEILSSKVNPPPPYLQFRAMEILSADKQTRVEFFDLAAFERGEMPADIKAITDKHPAFVNDIRKLLDTLLAGKK